MIAMDCENRETHVEIGIHIIDLPKATLEDMISDMIPQLSHVL